jgi:SsrA-binding protein
MSYVTNKKAHFDFEILKKYEAGVVLLGHEVKAVRSGKAKLEGSHVVVRGGEALLVGARISPYQEKNTDKHYDPDRPRTLLLSRKELAELESQSEQSSLTVVPISWYNARRNVKLEIALCRGKKKHDKREALKKRDSKREINRLLKTQ